MKKLLKLPVILFCALLLLVPLLFFAGGKTQSAYAASDPYSFEFKSFSVTYDIRSDLTMSVTEDFVIDYTGTRNTGFIRDLPVNAGDRVRKVRAYEYIDGKFESVAYAVNNDYADFISVDIGDRTYKSGQTHTYRITYDYAITKPTSKTTLYLNAIGFGSSASMENVEVTLNLPDGFVSAECYVGASGTTNKGDFTTAGNKITFSTDSLKAYNGVTFALQFKSGALSTKADATPYIIVVIGCAIMAILVAVKFLKFNRDDVTVVPNFDACEKYDPLMMGKLIDNKASGSDVTSLIYYWANKGYLKINIADENDIELIRITARLPENVPDYQRIMYENLFARGDSVRINSLKNVFYKTVERVTKKVNKCTSGIYDMASLSVAMFFAFLGGTLMAASPTLLGMFTIHISYIYVFSLFMIIPALIIHILSRAVYEQLPKLTKTKIILMNVGIALLAAAFSAVYVIFIPSHIVEIAPKIIICIIGFAIIIFSTSIISKTEEYRKHLGIILGFKDFIANVEKEKLEMMLKDNPEMYYQILPYAQVLSVSDIWQNKFKDLTVEPPRWITGYSRYDIYDYMLFCAIMNRMNANMASAFVSRPAPKGASGGGGGGHFGGFGGGGHGGGGFRGR